MPRITVGTRRLTKATLGIDVNTHAPSIVPIGAIIAIAVAPTESARRANVFLDGKEMQMFVWELKSRSEEVV